MDLTAEDLRRAMQRGEFSFHYQPKVSFLTGRVDGAEALIRWRLPDGTLVPPPATSFRWRRPTAWSRT